MDLVQKEHERLSKRLKSSQSIQNVQDAIDLLQSARDKIASGSSTQCDYAAGSCRPVFAVV